MLRNYPNPPDMECGAKMGAGDYFVKTEWSPDYIVRMVKKRCGL